MCDVPSIVLFIIIIIIIINIITIILNNFEQCGPTMNPQLIWPTTVNYIAQGMKRDGTKYNKKVPRIQKYNITISFDA
jgi:hypothetical protein